MASVDGHENPSYDYSEDEASQDGGRESDVDPDEPENEWTSEGRSIARTALLDKFWEHRGVTDTDWALGKMDEDYRGRLRHCLYYDANYQQIAPTGIDLDRMNTLQFVLQKARHWDHRARFDMAKCMIRLILEICKEGDNQQGLSIDSILYPAAPKADKDDKAGGAMMESPLFMAIEFDKEKRQQGIVTDFTRYIYRHLHDADVAAALAATNGKNETCLHLAIVGDVEGVEDLIRLANESILLREDQKSGNTPLHDALFFEKHLAIFPSCSGTEAERHRGDEIRLAEALKEDIPATETKDTDKLRGGSDETEATKVRQTTTQSDGTSICTTCATAEEEFRHAKSRRKRIVTEILKRAPSALTKHNGQGQSPYLYYLAMKTRYMNQVLTQTSSRTKPKASNTGSLPDQSRSRNPKDADRSKDKVKSSEDAKGGTKGSKAQMNGKDNKTPGDFEDGKKDPKDTKWKERERRVATTDEQGQSQVPQTPTNSHQPRPPSTPDGAGYGHPPRRPSKIDVPVVSRPPPNTMNTVRKRSNKPNRVVCQKHTLKKEVLWPNLEKELKEQAFALGGYTEAYKCLFQAFPESHVDDETSAVHGGRLQSWSLNKKDQKVTNTTTRDFNFQSFRPVLSDVTIDLRETASNLKDLDENEMVTRWDNTQTNLMKVFTWLNHEKRVECIMRLTVHDNPPYYCRDQTIQDCLTGLEVRYLDWNRPDLSARTLLVAPDLVQLDLYWSGNDAVMCSWGDEKGLGQLQKLRRIVLHTQKPREKPERIDRYVDHFKANLADWHNRHNSAIRSVVEDSAKDGDSSQDGPTVKTKTGTSHCDGNEWFAQARKFARTLASSEKVKALEAAAKTQKVKVAVIDDGVSPTYHGIGECLVAPGWPWNPSSGQDVFTSTNQHGTKMAYLIKSMCPQVEIYVAKLDGAESNASFRHRTFKLESATKAVKWATSKDVDIMCMSWNVKWLQQGGDDLEAGNSDEVNQLKDAVNAAHSRGILMYCAAGDSPGASGTNQKWVPCNLPGTYSVGATDNNGNMKNYVVNNSLDYLFPGENVLKETDPDSKEVGNSGATAIAAGFAALLLHCTKLQGVNLNKKQQLAYIESVIDIRFKKQETKVVEIQTVLLPKETGITALLGYLKADARPFCQVIN